MIPTINVKTPGEFGQQLRAVEDICPMVQIDVADGKFTSWENWHEPTLIHEMNTKAEFELHLMVAEPRKEMGQWSKLENVRRIIIHAESHFPPVEVGERNNLLDAMPSFYAYGLEVGVALNPETPIIVLEPLMSHLYYVMILGVNPGKSGQTLDRKVLTKIESLRNQHPTLNIEFDGGTDEKNIKEIVAAGANIICLGKAVFNDRATPKKNLERLREIIER